MQHHVLKFRFLGVVFLPVAEVLEGQPGFGFIIQMYFSLYHSSMIIFSAEIADATYTKCVVQCSNNNAGQDSLLRKKMSLI